MTDPDDMSRERDDRPTDPLPSRPEAEENGHAIPFGKGVYGLGRHNASQHRGEADQPYGEPSPVEPQPAEPPPAEPPPSEPRTSRSTAGSGDSGAFGGNDDAEHGQPSDFDFGRLAAELGFEGHAEGRQCVGFCPICRSADLVRTVATPELRAAWSEFSRELARALSAAAERYAGPADAEEPGRITEIPID